MTLPVEVIAAYSLEPSSLRPITIGLINQTFHARTREGRELIVQRLHHAFGAEVNRDIDVITSELASAGVTTPRIVRTDTSARWEMHEGSVYRALTYLEGHVHRTLPAAAHAREAGALAGRFHRALWNFQYSFRFSRPGAHDTRAHLERLEHSLSSADPETRGLADSILEYSLRLEPLPDLPRRIIHGDLKVTNLLFDREGERGVAVLDLDTIGWGSMAHEIGDALRSWCNPQGESSDIPHFRADYFESALEGWRDEMGDRITAEERSSIALGTETIALELASRFALDATLDSYFGWDSSRYPTRRAHNVARAKGQLALAQSIAAQRALLERIALR